MVTVKYNVSDVAGNQADEVSSIFTAVTTSSGITHLNNGGLVIFPNPANDFVYISCNQAITKISVVNTSGICVETLPVFIPEGIAEIDISQWPQGCYTIVIETENGETCRNAFIKNK